MIKNRLLLGFMLALTFDFSVSAQEFPMSKLEREARWQVYKNIAELENNSPLSTGSMEDRFMNLFDVDATHVIDFPMWNNIDGETVSIETYVDTYLKLFERGRKFRFSLVSMDFIWQGESYEVVTTVRKEFVGSTSEFDWRFENEEFHQDLTIVWKCDDVSALLDFWAKQKQLRSSRRRKPQLPFLIEEIRWAGDHVSTYVVLVDESKIQAEITCGGISLPGPTDNLAIYLNNDPTWILRDGKGQIADNLFEAAHFTIDDSILDILSPRSLVQTGNPKPWLLTLSGGGSLFAGGKMTSEMYESSTIQSSMGLGIGASVGYSVIQTHSKILDLYFTTALSFREFSIEVKNLQFSFPDIDPDNYPYERQVASLKWSEDVSEHALSLGVGSRYLKRIRGANSEQQLLAGASLEACYSLASRTLFSNETGVTYSGFYEEFFGMTIDQNGIYDFGTFTVSGSGSNTWNHAFSVPLKFVLGLKKNKLNPLTVLVSSGPAFHFRKGQAVAQEDFLLSNGLTSIVHQSNLFSFTTLDFQVGIRQRIGWKSLECETK